MSVSRMPASEKGSRYLGQLDQALCSGNWAEIQELARKTDKHAPERKCFTLAARSQAYIASASNRTTSGSSGAAASTNGLGELVPKLREAIGAEQKFPEDVFVARACLGEILWLKEDGQGALEALSRAGSTPSDGSGNVGPLGWIEVCEVKSSFIQARLLESSGKYGEAKQLYSYAAARAPGSRSPELRRWTERLLSRACLFMEQRASPPTIQALSESLHCFSAWSNFWQRASGSMRGGDAAPSHLDYPRRQVWRAYYELLSTILKYGLMYNPSPNSSTDLLLLSSDDMSDEQYTTAKRNQRAALRQVEGTYESLLLNETQFPKASQTNSEVDEWVELVAENWKAFCGSGWTDSELGEGGKESVGRGALDILYRAATKTFHSTATLRQLFTVHSALGEFDLAMHAFDSYVEIVSRGKARAAKTGKDDAGVDGDNVAVMTAVEAVRILCRYGDREQAEKAVAVGKIIKEWLDLDSQQGAEQAKPPKESRLHSKTKAAAFQAMGLIQAHWARLTFDTDSRSSLQADALENLKLSQQHDPEDLDTAHILALLLAETREVGAATQVIKRAISSPDSTEDDEDADIESGDCSRERRLVPLWHLLALCLTAKDDYEQAGKMCEAAFEQFGDPAVLFGESSNRRSTESEKPLLRASRGVVDQMEGFEKEGILQIKMSQLALVELMEGAEAAVDISHQLLALYSRLFGSLESKKEATKPPPRTNSAVPSKKAGTLRSLAGSIRPKSGRYSSVYRQASIASQTEPRTSVGSRAPPTAVNGQDTDVPIAITVTNEDGINTEKQHQHHTPFKLRGQHGDWREHGNLKSTRSSESIRARSNSKPEEVIPPVPPLPKTVQDEANVAAPVKAAVEQSASLDAPTSPDQPIDLVHNEPHDHWPLPAGHVEQFPRQDIRLPAPHPSKAAQPEPRFPSAQDRQHRTTLLVKVWLFIAGMYLRADLLDDANEAVTEAHKLVESFEMEVAAERGSARQFFEKGWAGGKSVDQLWADVLAAKGALASAKASPFRAIEAYERSLAHFPDHADGIIGLSNILMDIFEEKTPAEEPHPVLQDAATSGGAPRSTLASPTPETPKPPPQTKTNRQDPTPAELNRLAARDRAYMLLSNLTRLGSGWDNPEAWYTLARAYELSKQIGKAKKALWWVVELEENKPIRAWSEVFAGGSAVL